jgi:hypothetical protein
MSINHLTTRITPMRAYTTRVSAKGRAFELGAVSRAIAVTQVTTGLTGAPGSQGIAQISTDPGNQLTQGSDNRLFVPAPASSDLTYNHNQAQAVDIWLITHGLGKYPAVAVVDSAGDLVDGDVRYLDANSLQITFSSAFAGQAHLN